MIIREALLSDIPAMHRIRLAVQENVLSDPTRVTPEDYTDYLSLKGRGWVSEEEDQITGFAIIDREEHNVWALFIHPHWEGKGIGRQLHNRMLAWYFSQTDQTLWLSTEQGTRAEAFYRKRGWQEAGWLKDELRFEMTLEKWTALHAK